jgi:DNA-binding response OmpR family regulator
VLGKEREPTHGSLPHVDVLLVSPDPASRELMALAVRSIERRLGEELRFRAAKNGDLGTKAALRDRPEVIIADELASREGAFSLARTLRDDRDPYRGVIVILLERMHDAWLARWSGADAWYVKPADPFEVADRLLELLEEKGLVRHKEQV